MQKQMIEHVQQQAEQEFLERQSQIAEREKKLMQEKKELEQARIQLVQEAQRREQVETSLKNAEVTEERSKLMRFQASLQEERMRYQEREAAMQREIQQLRLQVNSRPQMFRLDQDEQLPSHLPQNLASSSGAPQDTSNVRPLQTGTVAVTGLGDQD